MNMIGYFDNPSGEVHRLKLNRAAINLSYILMKVVVLLIELLQLLLLLLVIGIILH